MKKNLIATLFTLGLIGNVFAECDTTPYNAPEDLQPACTADAPATPAAPAAPTIPATADKTKANEKSDADKKRNSNASEKPATEKSNQSAGK